VATPDELWPEVKQLEAACLEIVARAVRGELTHAECRAALEAYLAARLLVVQEAMERAERGEGQG
jgi:hypothetical protein